MRKISSFPVHIDILKKKKNQIVYYCCLIFTESTVKGFNNKSRVFGVSVLLLFLVFCVVCSFFSFFFCLSSLCVFHPMLPVSLDFPFLITPSVFSNVYIPKYKTSDNYRKKLKCSKNIYTWCSCVEHLLQFNIFVYGKSSFLQKYY